jgi:hypothetical protein
MNSKISALLGRIEELERELERELEEELRRKREEFSYRFEATRVDFARRVLEFHKRFRTGVMSYLWASGPIKLLIAPVIYSFILPLAALDLWLWVYQAVSFPIYGIAKVDRAQFLVFDRSLLAYLNPIEKFNCGYCSYANGLIAYTREVAARTEQYFCPIKHARKRIAAHARYQHFFDFGDAEGYRRGLEKLREELRPKV